MSLESTLTDIIARLRQGRYPSGCHPEPVEGSQMFTICRHQPQQHTEKPESDETPYAVLPWQTIIKLAAEVAGLNFGKDVVVEF